MKYYSEAKIPKNEYIKDYKIKGDTIICRLANGEKYILPNTEENVKRIEEIRTDQAIILSDNLSDGIVLSCRFTKFIVTLINGCIQGLVIFSLPLMWGGNYQPIDYIKLLLLSLSSTCIGNFIYGNAQKTIDDYEKINIFLNDTETLNDEVKKDVNVLNGVSKKNKKEIESREEVFTFDLIDKMTLKELKTIKSNIERNHELRFPKTFEVKNKIKEKKKKINH